MKDSIPLKTVERLILYKRLLKNLNLQGIQHCYSHQLAVLANNSSAQVRRDLMQIGYTGSPRTGYVVDELIERIHELLENPILQKIALVGVGNLGRSILSYFSYRQPNLEIAAAFDSDPARIDRVISGCRCYNITELDAMVQKKGITLGVITVPAQYAQATADSMVNAGISGILNFAPVPIRVPDHVFTDELDITMKLEKLAYLIKK